MSGCSRVRHTTMVGHSREAQQVRQKRPETSERSLDKGLKRSKEPSTSALLTRSCPRCSATASRPTQPSWLWRQAGAEEERQEEEVEEGEETLTPLPPPGTPASSSGSCSTFSSRGHGARRPPTRSRGSGRCVPTPTICWPYRPYTLRPALLVFFTLHPNPQPPNPERPRRP